MRDVIVTYGLHSSNVYCQVFSLLSIKMARNRGLITTVSDK